MVQHIDLNIEETHHCSALTNVHMDGDLAQIQRDLIARQRNNVDSSKSMGHVVMKEARKVATAKVARSIQDQAVIELGARKFEMSDSRVALVSNRYDSTFRAVNHINSEAVYCAYKP